MTRSTLLFRSLQHYWRSHVAVGLGVMVATATLTGALLVGDSMRGSLHDLAVGRLGRVNYALVSSNFFREALAGKLSLPEQSKRSSQTLMVSPVILARASITHADTAARVSRINALGVDDSFWKLGNDVAVAAPTSFSGRSVILNEPLAFELGAHKGDDVLLRLGKPSQVSTETLLGRRDDTSVTLRLTVADIVSANDLGGFSLSPKQSLARNAFVPLQILQRAFDQKGRVSAMLVANSESNDAALSDESEAQQLTASLRKHLTIEDLGLSLRIDQARGYLALESQVMLLDPHVEQLTLEISQQLNVTTASVLTYLANEINRPTIASPQSPADEPTTGGIPYSTITATSIGWTGATKLTLAPDHRESSLKPGQIVLNQWAADDLHAKIGDRIEVSYYVTQASGELRTEKASFTLRGVATMNDRTLDPGFTPTYKGITDTRSLSEWDAPFPIDLRQVRDKDDAYWEKYRTAPKAFICLEDGRRLWTKNEQRLGQATSIRIYPTANQSLQDLRTLFESSLRKKLNPKDFGLSFDPIRKQLADASQGSTDFGMLFIGFSFFLIASGAMLIALLYRLGIERRATDIGTLLAAGWPTTMVNRTIILEGAIVAALGSSLGLVAAMGYAQLMLLGLRSWWVDAINTPFLTLHVSSLTLLIGLIASFTIAVGSMAWSVRGLVKLAPRALISGSVQAGVIGGSSKTTRRAQWVTWIGIGSAVGLALTSLLSDAVPMALGFFGTGSAMLVGCLGTFAWWLGSSRRSAIAIHTRNALTRLGAANCVRNPGRSLLTVGLMASATFLVVSLEAFRLEPDTNMASRNTGTGGFELLAESTAPLAYDLNTSQGRQALGIDDSVSNSLASIKIFPLRLRPGDESSCLNLYKPTKPRIVGASDALIARGGFRFSGTIAADEQHIQNPWSLLNKTFDDGAVPIIGDEAAVLWQLHSGLGQDMLIKDQRGQDVKARFVALLSGSVLQDELIVAQSHFVDLFPGIEGSTFFLIDTGEREPTQVQNELERELGSFGFDATSTRLRLRQFLAVQNTYLGTFQMLGGLGLILGTVGLAVVLLRNTWERRAELALLRALGFTNRDIRTVVLAENTALVCIGLAAGTIPAFIAIAPALSQRASTLPWGSVAIVVIGVVLVGIGVAALVLRSALKMPLIPALRAE